MSSESFVTFVAGVRPNFVKLAPLVRAVWDQGITSRIVHTGQHYDHLMSEAFFRDLGIPQPDAHFSLPSEKSRGERIDIMQSNIEQELLFHPPNCLFVFGDVDSSVAAAKAARSQGVLLAHYESGLRAKGETLIEEENRRLIDAYADIHFVTEPDALRNLRREAVTGKAHFVGNLMIDTLRQFIAEIDKNHDGVPDVPYILFTLHRSGNVDNPEKLREIVEAVARLKNRAHIIMPVHPRTKIQLGKNGIADDRITYTDPLPYVAYHSLMKNSLAVITDSGSTSEELADLGVPCLLIRQSTERPITVSRGTTTIVGDNFALLPSLLDRIKLGKYKKPKSIKYWDGRSAVRIAVILKKHYVH